MAQKANDSKRGTYDERSLGSVLNEEKFAAVSRLCHRIFPGFNEASGPRAQLIDPL